MPKQNYQEIVTIVLVGTTITLLVVGFLVSFVYMYQQRHFKYLREKEKLENDYQQTLLQTRLEIQEETFKTISQEIHDNIGQALSFVKLTINTVDVYNPEAAKEKLLQSKNQLSQTIQDLRDIAKSLNPDFISELGLAGAIELQLALLQKTGMYQTVLTVSGQPYKNNLQDVVVYRIVQELLNNIVKHAQANSIGVVMSFAQTGLVITVKDNGRGFDTSLAGNRSGLGLANMGNRAALINGSVKITSGLGAGTEATITVKAPNSMPV
jgi:signal transduction histidine kinase